MLHLCQKGRALRCLAKSFETSARKSALPHRSNSFIDNKRELIAMLSETVGPTCSKDPQTALADGLHQVSKG
jgi:hypothetical protein